jgi:hypothetical protein
MNNDKVAAQLDLFLAKHRLDGYAGKRAGP